MKAPDEVKDPETMKEFYTASLDALYEDLKKKALFVSEQLNKPQGSQENDQIWANRMKRLRKEEEHILICMDFIHNSKRLIEMLQVRLEIKTRTCDHFYNEFREYMGKYYDLGDKVFKSHETDLLKVYAKNTGQ